MRRKFGETTIEQFWRCGACGTICPALHSEDQGMRCTGCGKQKSEEDGLTFGPQDIQTAPAITDPELLKLTGHGPNRICPFCRTEERAFETECSNCGRPMDGSEKRVQVRASEAPSRPRRQVIFHDPTATPRFSVRFWILLGVGGAVLLGLIIWGLIVLFASHEDTVRVTAMHWQRHEVLEERVLEPDQGWKNQVPGDAVEVKCTEKQRGTKQCEPYDCNHRMEEYTYDCEPVKEYACAPCARENCRDQGDGTLKCDEVCEVCTTDPQCKTGKRPTHDTCYKQCPVMEMHCSYLIPVWKRRDEAVREGSDQSPEWPGLVARGSNQRVSQTESYMVLFQSASDLSREWEKRYSLSEYGLFRVDQVYHATWTHAGTLDVKGAVMSP